MSLNSYWENRLQGLEFGSYFNIGDHDTEERCEFAHSAPQKLYSRLNALAPSDEAKHIILLGALAVLVHKYKGISDILLLTPTFKDNVSKGLAPIRVNIGKEMTFKDVILDLKSSVVNDFHHNLPLDKILGPKYEELNGGAKVGLMVEGLQNFSSFQGMDLEFLLVFNTKNSLRVNVNYMSGAFSENSLERIIGRYFDLLDFLLNNLDIQLSGTEILSKEEKDEMLVQFNSTNTVLPIRSTVLSLFEKQVQETPLKVALDENGIQLSYIDLSRKVNQMAFYLKKNIGIGSGDLVGILMVPEVNLIVSILGVLKAGAAYIPLEYELTPSRRNLIITKSGIEVLITQLPISDLNGSLRIVDLNQEMDLISNQKVDDTVFDVIQGTDTAYIIYTSGSTGEPKGVKIAHESLLNYITWAFTAYGDKYSQLDFPLFTSLSFDLTLTSIFVPLTSGGKIMIYGGGKQVFRLQEILKDNGVSIIKLTPSHLRIIKDYEELKEASSLRRIIVGGEALEQSLAFEVNEKLNGRVEIYNEYGPTEATVGCMIYRFNPKDVFTTVPIGKPISNVKVYVLNKDLEPTPFEVPGELYISGVCLAQGYLKNEEMTSSRFLSNPFEDGKKMYKTGDLVKWLPNGTLEFLDRVDNQVKIRGYRIELGAVESSIRQIKQVHDVVVISTKINHEKCLVAYYCVNGKISKQHLQTHLKKRLPSYMIPSFLIELESIPLTTNGKVDRKSLPNPRSLTKIKKNKSTSGNEIEQQLLSIWSKLLDFDEERIGLNDDFFALGGHSILAVRLHQSIEHQFKVSIGLKGVFENSTIKELAVLIECKELSNTVMIPKVERKIKKYYESSSAQERLFCEYMIAPTVLTNNCAQAFEITGEFNAEKLEDSFQFLLERHDGLRCNFFLDGKDVFQTVKHHVLFNLEIYPSDEHESIESAFNSFVRPFDLTKDLLFRAALWINTEKKKYLLVDVHHIVCDGFSMNILMNEFKKNYEGQILPKLHLSYLDYASWQRNVRDALNKERIFWSDKLKGELPKTNLPIKRKRNNDNTHYSQCLTLELSEGQYEVLKKEIINLQVTSFMFLISIYYLMIHKLSGCDEITIGTDSIGRTNNELKGIVGTFVNVLPLRVKVESQVSFRSFLDLVKESVLEAFENQEFPFDEMKALVKSGAHNSIFDVYFSNADLFNSEIETTHLNFHPLTLTKEKPVSRYELELSMEEVGTNLHLNFLYSTLMYDESTIKLFMTYYRNILKIVLSDLDVQISAIALEEALIN